ncbi:MAG: hypothetical protein OXC11_16160 [Rhodospirillales bacterium]|nr:hypothetical protein [Rhodospirillales bacterium]
MSLENLKEYARRCAPEPDLRAEAKALGTSDIDGHIRHAGNLGLDWTAQDMVAFRKEVIDAGGDLEDLSEEELEQVAGGAVSTTMAVAAAAIAALGVAGGVTAGAVAGAAVGATAGSVASGGGW